MTEPRTCPSCGALTTPQLVRCRRCKRYLHGTRLEGALFAALPGPLARSPGTGLMLLLVLGTWLAMVAATRFDGVLAFDGYSLRQLGAMHVPFVLDGEWWRFGSSMLAHADLIHLAFNTWALLIVGSVVEALYGRHKAWLVFSVSGVLAMVASFGWNAFLAADASIATTSIGASGAVSGLLGAALVRGYRDGRRQLTRLLGRWALYIAISGLLIPGIDNAAHAGGFVVGALLALVLRPGLSDGVTARRVWSVGTLGAASGLLACVVTAFVGASAYPTTLAADAQPKTLLGFEIRRGTSWAASTQRDALGACVRAVEQHQAVETVETRCQFARRASPYHPVVWLVLAEVEASRGNGLAARRYERIGQALDQATSDRRTAD